MVAGPRTTVDAVVARHVDDLNLKRRLNCVDAVACLHRQQVHVFDVCVEESSSDDGACGVDSKVGCLTAVATRHRQRPRDGRVGIGVVDIKLHDKLADRGVFTDSHSACVDSEDGRVVIDVLHHNVAKLEQARDTVVYGVGARYDQRVPGCVCICFRTASESPID